MSKLNSIVLVGTIVVLSGPLVVAAISTTFFAASLLLVFAGGVFIHAVLKSLYQVTTWPFSTAPVTLPNPPRNGSPKTTKSQTPPLLAINTGRWTTGSNGGSCSPESDGSVTSSYSRSSSGSVNGGGSGSGSVCSSSSSDCSVVEQSHGFRGASQVFNNVTTSVFGSSLRGGLGRRRRPAASLVDFYDFDPDEVDGGMDEMIYFPDDQDVDGPWSSLNPELSRHRNRSHDHQSYTRRHRSASAVGITPPVASNSSRRRASIAELPSVLHAATMSSVSYRRASTPGRRGTQLSDYGL